MHQQQNPAPEQYPHGRGYGHDYMRGGEISGGYGYSNRDEYALPRGELAHEPPRNARGDDSSPEGTPPSQT